MNDNRKTIAVLVRAPQHEVEAFEKMIGPNLSKQDVLKVLIRDVGEGRLKITEPRAEIVEAKEVA
jgi:hypothetical protein